VALLNGGFDGIPVREGEKYDLSVFAKQLEGKGGKIRVSLVQDGRVVAQTTLKAPKSDWKKMTAVLKADADADQSSMPIVSSPAIPSPPLAFTTALLTE
jgi:hypothetical protein